MSETALLPTGRLQSVQRQWDFQAGWVRAPLREIVFNDRLSKQTRLVWLWLASVPEGAIGVSWAECETLLRCSTTARRRCISQLAEEGFIEVLSDGVVVMRDPYAVFDDTRKEILDSLREEWDDNLDLITASEVVVTNRNAVIVEKKIDKHIEKIQKETKSKPKPAAKKPEKKSDEIIDAWNNCKPETYSTVRVISERQRMSIKTHMANLGLSPGETWDFICSVCKGLKKSQWWSKTVDQSGRNFNAVFGYGQPQDKKLRNIENLYSAGHEELPEITPEIKKTYNLDQQELIDAYKFSTMNFENARRREDANEQEHWQKHITKSITALAQAGINVDEL